MTPLPHMDKHPPPMVTPYRAPAVKPPHLHRRRANEIRWCCPPSTSMLPLSSSTTQTIFPSSPAASTSHPAPQSLRCPSVWWPHYLCRPPPSFTNSSMSSFRCPQHLCHPPADLHHPGGRCPYGAQPLGASKPPKLPLQFPAQVNPQT